MVVMLFLGTALAVCPGDPFCQQCDPSGNGKCIYCAYSYPDDNGTCVPTNTVQYCYSYGNATTCNECQDGTFDDKENQKCIPLDPSIIKTCLHAFNSTTKCDICPNSILSTNGGCNTTNRCTDKNCYACYWNTQSKQQVCWICSPGYVLWSAFVTGTACFKAPNLTGCYSSQDVSTCLNCNIGYYMSASGCVANPALNYNVPGAYALLFSALITLLMTSLFV